MFEAPNTAECFVLLENTRNADEPARLYRHPVASLTAGKPEDLANALRELERLTQMGLHACGYITYEAGYALQNLPLTAFAKDIGPLLHFELFAECELITQQNIAAWLTAADDEVAVHGLSLGEDEAAYAAKIARIHAHIRAGDSYQVNYTLPCHFQYAGSPLALYRALRDTQHVEFAAFMNFPEAQVLSLSPELFLRRQGNTLLARPMKGTAARGADAASDAAQTLALQNDPKSRAENLMIVDLLRNDLGRVCRTGSVKVTSMFDIETFETLHQMTSAIQGEVKAETGLAEILTGLFPCGSITGAPKHKTMQIIADLEQQPRGIYTGAIGYIEPGGNFCFNVPIRTVVSSEPGVAVMGVGSGIVNDSVAADEYKEVELKARFLKDVNQALGLLESMRLEADGQIPLLSQHLARLARSASVFGFACPLTEIQRTIAIYIEMHRSAVAQRLRLCLSDDGRVLIDHFPIPATPADARLVISSQTINSQSILRQHKTTQRQLYETEYARATADGAYEVLFLNERQEIVEAARHNIFIERAGRLLTPPLNAGALPGILRQQLLDSGRAIEHSLTLADLEQAEAIFLGNAVRGLQGVSLSKTRWP